MQVARTREQLADALAILPVRTLVPTMGALHPGHLALVAAAQQEGPVVASIFVNPLQFGPSEDLARYPRDEAGDLTMLAEAGCSVAFLPDFGEVYLPEDATTIDVTGPALGWEGARRPGHFRGVATVVARLFGLVAPMTAWFGEKDWQQLQVIRRMTTDLCLPVAIRAHPTVRATDGLALSSRNRYLTSDERSRAPLLAQACHTAATAIRAGNPTAQALEAGIAALSEAGFAVDYLVAVDSETLIQADGFVDAGRLIAAALLGRVRLLDNVPI